MIILAPESRGGTWDGIRGSYGPDIEFLNRALAHTFDWLAVDRRRLAIGGFPMALRMDCPSVSPTATSLRTSSRARQASPSPARCAAVRESSCPTARPTILPISSTSRRIVPELEKLGYTVTYREFDGPHTVPPAIARDGFAWFTGANARTMRGQASRAADNTDNTDLSTPLTTRITSMTYISAVRRCSRLFWSRSARAVACGRRPRSI